MSHPCPARTVVPLRSVIPLVLGLVLLISLAGCDDGDERTGTAAASTTSVVTGECDDELSVFLHPHSSLDDLMEVADEISRIEGVEAYSTFDQDQTYAEFQDLFADTPEIADSVTPDILPPSVRVHVNGDATIDEITGRYEHDARVREVVTPLDPGLVDALAEQMQLPEYGPPCEGSPPQSTTTR